jgi:hypothetical protein
MIRELALEIRNQPVQPVRLHALVADRNIFWAVNMPVRKVLMSTVVQEMWAVKCDHLGIGLL